MRIAVLGGAGAMGGLFGARLATAGNDVVQVDVWQEAVTAINQRGLVLTEKSGETRTIPVRATTDAAAEAPADLLIVFVKSYHTRQAIEAARALLHGDTVVLTLQNGWGNAPRIAELVGSERILAGVTYNSATVLGPGQIQQAGVGATIVGELDGGMSERLSRIVGVLAAAGMEARATGAVLEAIWAKLALNVCTLPTSALLRFYAGQLIEQEGSLALMRALLQETVAVARAQGIALDESERWAAITGLLGRAQKARASMLQDVEAQRKTEIDVINGAIVRGGLENGVPTPYNQAMVWMIRALEDTFPNTATAAKR